MQRMHPLRLPYELISDRNPWVAPVAQVADQARQHRQPVAPDNPYAVLERMASDTIEAGLNMWQELRDAAGEQLFMNVYGSPLRSEEHTSELQSLMRISYAVFCLKKKKHFTTQYITQIN